MPRSCFYSFHYGLDAHRAAQVRSIGVIEGNQPARDNDWESIKRGGDAAITRWIADQLRGRSCTVVLVGAETSRRQWVLHEIIESWRAGMGVVGVRIHGLKNLDGQTSAMGANPFDGLTFNNRPFSSVVQCYDPRGLTSKDRYAWISQNLSAAVEEAVRIRKAN